MTNPYLKRPWSPELLSAYQDMPKNQHGQIVSLFFALRHELTRLEREWHEWMRRHPKAIWPEWVYRWADAKKRANKVH